VTVQTLYAANGDAKLPVLNNRKLLIIRLLTAFTGVHGSEREHLGRFRDGFGRFKGGFRRLKVMLIVVRQAHHSPLGTRHG